MRLNEWLGSDLIRKPVWFVQYDGFCRFNTGFGEITTVGQMSEGYQEGDRIGIHLDMTAGTMSVFINGRDSGVVVTGVQGPVRPVFNLDDRGDCLELTHVDLHLQLDPATNAGSPRRGW